MYDGRTVHFDQPTGHAKAEGIFSGIACGLAVNVIVVLSMSIASAMRIQEGKVEGSMGSSV